MFLPTATVTVLASVKRPAPPSVAVTRTVFAPPPSARLPCTLSVSVSASTVRVSAVGAASSSLRVISVSVTSSAPATPVTSILSLPSASASSTGVRSNVPAPLAAPAAMTMLKPDTAA